MDEKGSLPPSAPYEGQKMDNPPPYSSYPTMPQETPMMQPNYPAGPPQPVVHPTAVQPAVVQVVQVPPKLTAVGPESVRLTCPHCQADVNTRVDKDPSIAAYVSAAVLFLVGCVCGCCLIPFCIDSCKTSEHYCANCNKFIGRYSKY